MFATTLALALIIQDVVPEHRRGATLYTDCIATVRELDGATSAQSNIASSSRCINYMAGFTDGMTMFDNGCFPKNATMGTVVRLYVAYMRAHPKLMDDERSTGVVMAIADAYPCQKK